MLPLDSFSFHRSNSIGRRPVTLLSLFLMVLLPAVPASATPPRAQKVLVMNVPIGDVTVTKSFPGEVISAGDVFLSPKVSEPILAIKVKVGDSVTVGQTLAILDSQVESRKVAASQSNLSTAEQQLKNSQTQFAKQKALLNSQLATLKVTLSGLQAQVKAAEVNEANNSPVYQVAVDQATFNVQSAKSKNLIKALNYQAAVDTASNNLDQAKKLASAYQNLMSDPTTVDALVHSGTASAACPVFGLTGASCTSSAVSNAYSAFLTVMTNLKNANLAFQTAAKQQEINLAGDRAQIVTLNTALSNAVNAQIIGTARDGQVTALANQAVANLNSQIDGLKLQMNYTDIVQDSSSVLSAKLELKLAKENLAATVLTSPVNGVIGSINNIVGQTPALVKFQADGENSGMFVITAVSNLQIASSVELKIGEQLRQSQGATFEFAYPAKFLLKGSISEMKIAPPTFKHPSRTLLTFNLEKLSPDIYPGETGTVSVSVIGARHVLLVPNKALLRTANNFFYVMKQAIVKGKSKFVKTRVQVGAQGTVSTEITSGLTEQDQIRVTF